MPRDDDARRDRLREAIGEALGRALVREVRAESECPQIAMLHSWTIRVIREDAPEGAAA